MKTRIIHTKIWKDRYFSELSRAEKLLFIYLITNEQINMVGVYELTDREILFDTGLTQQELEDAKAKLSRDRKFLFSDCWVKVLNHDKYNTYGKGERQLPAYEKELANIPDTIRNLYPSDTSIDTSIYTNPILDINHKSKNIIHKSKYIKELSDILEYFNQTFNKKFKTTTSWEKNAERWLEVYSLDEIKEAIDKWNENGWWGEPEQGLELLFRTSNKQGACDYIGQLLNSEKKEFVI